MVLLSPCPAGQGGVEKEKGKRRKEGLRSHFPFPFFKKKRKKHALAPLRPLLLFFFVVKLSWL